MEKELLIKITNKLLSYELTALNGASWLISNNTIVLLFFKATNKGYNFARINYNESGLINLHLGKYNENSYGLPKYDTFNNINEKKLKSIFTSHIHN
jgi:hypothetical protein